MRVTAIMSTALLLFCEANTIAAKATIYMPRGVRRRALLGDDLSRTAIHLVEDKVMRREAQSSTPSSTATSTSSSDLNATISSACMSGLAAVQSVSNEAGITACYNVLQYDSTAATFQADLRIYQTGQASGDFLQIPLTDLTVGLNYPPSTQFQVLMKRSIKNLGRRELSMSEVQQYSLFGGFQQSMDIAKLNSTQLMSLMVPMITINARQTSSHPALSTNLTSSDTVYFVFGDFKNQFSTAAVNPASQAAAIAASTPFQLPGRTLGIFPTGLIVTGIWMILFVIAYGVGTFGRIRHRNIYRKRMAATAGRTGKRMHT